MFYIKWNKNDISNLSFNYLLTEIDETGIVKREIGLNENDDIVHKAPSNDNQYGLFDNQKIEVVGLISNISKEEFEKYWTLS